MGKRIVRTVIMGLMLLALPNFASASDPAEDVISNSKKYIGVPYVFGGNTPSGFDCSGFIRHVYKESGITLPRTSAEQFKAGDPVAKEDLQKGDLVFFETYKPGPSHSGIYLGDGKFIHASSTKGITISSLNNPYYWEPKYLGARQIIPQVKGASDHAVEYNKEYWAYEQIESLKQQGVLNAKGFEHEKPVREGQAVKMLKNALIQQGLSNEQAMQELRERNVLNGDTTISSTESMTREKAIMVLTRALLTEQQGESAQAVSFKDFDSSHRGYAEVAQAIELKLITGYHDGTFKPHNKMKQSEFSVLVHRTLNLNK